MASPDTPTILCAGIAVLDQVFGVDRFPVGETKTRAHSFASTVGGGAANAAVAIARLDGRARLAAPLGGPAGSDSVGDRIIAILAQEGVESNACVRVAGVEAPLSAILIDQAGERAIVNHRSEQLAAARVGDLDKLVSDVDAVLADNIFADFVLPICAAAQRRGIPVIIDGDRSMHEQNQLMAAASHIVFSAEGLRGTAGIDDLSAALLRVAGRCTAFIAVTDGTNDVLWLDRGTVHRMPTFSIVATDTLAAGDVFHGAFALAIAEGRQESDALRFAAAVAAIKCSRFGGGSSTPTRAEVKTFLSGRQA